jgi:hypothetical protein
MPDTIDVPKRGALPTPRSVLAAATPYVADARLGAPAEYIVIPPQLSMWGNDVHGDCVTAEEAFAKACYQPEIFITDGEVINWATRHGVLEGAYINQVLDWMVNDGFHQDGQIYDDGGKLSVNWTNTSILKDAISQGPVKLGIAADQIETAYQRHNGWFATGFHADANEDHSVALCGYGSMSWLAQQLGVSVPSGVNGNAQGYALFTWDTIGIIDEPSMRAITHEAWLRMPTTVIVSAQGVRIHVCARGGDGAVWHRWQTAPNNGWSDWYSLGGWVDLIKVATNQDGRLEIFARGGDGAVWHNWEVSPGGGWSGWYSMGGWIDRLDVARNADGRLEIFARGGDGAVWHMWQTAPNNGWSDWYSLGGWIDMLDVARNADGRLEIFARGGDGAIWHMWQTAPNNGWSDWYSLGGWVDMLDLGRNADGRLEIFARGGDGAVWHMWQTAPNNGWSDWYSLGGWIDLLKVSSNDDSRMEIFARGGDGAVWHMWQTAPSNGWSGWNSLGGWIDILEVWPEAPGNP